MRHMALSSRQRLENSMNIPEWIKPAFYGAVGGAIALAIVGFNWGGWVTGGTASEMVADASQDAREQLVASICVERFVDAPNAVGKLAELKEVRSYEQDSFIEDGGWIQVDALEEQVSGAAELCADQLVAMESLPERAVEPAEATAEPTITDG
jgi:hypothetical protein